MKTNTLLAAAATLALVGGASAFAQEQPASKPDTSVNPPAASTDSSTSATASTPAPLPSDATVSATSTTETAPAAAGAATAASVTTTMVSNGPVPDTAENRAKYGQPLSRAGKRTAARGN